jgi:inosine/xanthosine triphosphatase
MKKIIVASTNPIKIKATLDGFKRIFPIEEFIVEGISVESGVKDQPNSDQETFRGALNRVDIAFLRGADADYYVGLEGGIESRGDEMESFAWIVVKSNNGLIGKARTGTFFLPPKIVELIHSGLELGEADDIVFGKTNSKQSNGAVGLLTKDLITRSSFYEEAIILALIPFKNLNLYS